MRLPPVPLPTLNTGEFVDLLKSNGNSMDYERLKNDDDDDSAPNAEPDEYYGKANQIPITSDHFTRNFSQSTHLTWNSLYYPFNSFPSLPFDSKHNFISLRSFESLEFNYAMQNFTYGGADGSTFHHYLSGNYQQEQFTLVVLTFKRESMLVDMLSKYVNLPYLHSILVVWNAVDSRPSEQFVNKLSTHLKSARIRVIRSEKNSLNNRFLPYADLIKTDAVLNLDDDTLLRSDEIMFAFRVWRENREKIVGFPARYHTWNFTTKTYEYRHDLSCEYSMILTGAAFYHQFYNYAFTYLMEKRIRDYVDSVNNCEDIAFNMLVSHLTRRPPLKVTLKYNFYCAECEMLSKNKNEKLAVSLQKGHYEQRTKCLQFFQNVYGYNPLLYSQFRADSVLYRTRLPTDKQRCFKLI
jgi:alpha-1,4-N-acetylglucosaminyltransferase EXTL3